MDTDRLMLISGPSASTGVFGLCHVRPTTVRNLRLVVATVSWREPQIMITTGYGHLATLNSDQGQWWCGAASVKPHRTALLTDRTALVVGWSGPAPVTETCSHVDERAFDPMHELAVVCMVIRSGRGVERTR
jgi:hypothetical protein